MRSLQQTNADVPANLALDEALLLSLESPQAQEVFRVWEPQRECVVIGRGSRVRQEVRVEVCQQQGIPITRRCSGGAAIVAGPGCLLYAVTLRLPSYHISDVDAVHEFVLGRIAAGLATGSFQPARLGTSDLTLGMNPARKFSGNSLRLRGRGANATALYHGTILYDFPSIA